MESKQNVGCDADTLSQILQAALVPQKIGLTLQKNEKYHLMLPG